MNCCNNYISNCCSSKNLKQSNTQDFMNELCFCTCLKCLYCQIKCICIETFKELLRCNKKEKYCVFDGGKGLTFTYDQLQKITDSSSIDSSKICTPSKTKFDSKISLNLIGLNLNNKQSKRLKPKTNLKKDSTEIKLKSDNDIRQTDFEKKSKIEKLQSKLKQTKDEKKTGKALRRKQERSKKSVIPKAANKKFKEIGTKRRVSYNKTNVKGLKETSDQDRNKSSIDYQNYSTRTHKRKSERKSERKTKRSKSIISNGSLLPEILNNSWRTKINIKSRARTENKKKCSGKKANNSNLDSISIAENIFHRKSRVDEARISDWLRMQMECKDFMHIKVKNNYEDRKVVSVCRSVLPLCLEHQNTCANGKDNLCHNTYYLY